MEADGLRWSLLIIGSLVIVGLAVHGIWLSRKNSENKTKTPKHKKDQEYQPSGWLSDDDNFDASENEANNDFVVDSDLSFNTAMDDNIPDFVDESTSENEFDDLGVGAVRVVSNEAKVDTDSKTEQTPSADTQAEPEASSSKIYASVVTQPKPEYAAKYSSLAAETVAISQQERESSNNNQGSPKAVPQPLAGTSTNAFSANDNYQAPEPPPFLLKKAVPEESVAADVIAKEPVKVTQPAPTEQTVAKDEPHSTLAEKLSLSEQARNLVKRKKADTVRKRREPKIAEDQLRIDFDEQPSPESKPEEVVKAKAVEAEQAQEVLVLNVKSADDNPIPGSALLPMLLTLGFKFGDQDIFHRHVNSNGKGPVLFSLANMFKPGNFDIDNLENFTTGGISLFMILPIEGEPHQVFNMMHNAARKIAEEFSAQIYDGRRTLLTKQSLQQYVEKIREFERQRLLKG
jgi:cell division protein ZipA